MVRRGKWKGKFVEEQGRAGPNEVLGSDSVTGWKEAYEGRFSGSRAWGFDYSSIFLTWA